MLSPDLCDLTAGIKYSDTKCVLTVPTYILPVLRNKGTARHLLCNFLWQLNLAISRNRQIDRQAVRQASRQTNRQRDRQTGEENGC